MASSSRCGGSGPLFLLSLHMCSILFIKHRLIAVHNGFILDLVCSAILGPCLRRWESG
ncbi:hypothetical protein A2U01_0095810, partial [Trifolium medium]|nr:hypothetical protein [Trifolium medium]